MAIYHLSVKTVSRAAGRSATAAAAYRAADVISDERSGLCHDYTRKKGVEHSEIMVPNGVPMYERNELWNAAEKAEKRKNSTVAREFEYAIPHELNPKQRVFLVRQICKEIADRHGCAVDFSIHKPHDKTSKNTHAHILMTTRRMTKDGLGEKTRELDDLKSGEVVYWRERIATITNEHLAAAKIDARVDHRSHKARGLTDIPGSHLGPAVSQIVARCGDSHVIDRIKVQADEAIKKAQRQARESGEMAEMIANILSHIDTSKLELDALKAQHRAADLLDRIDAADARVDDLKRKYQPSIDAMHAAEQSLGYVADKSRVANASFIASVKYFFGGAVKELRNAESAATAAKAEYTSIERDLSAAKSDLAQLQAQLPPPPAAPVVVALTAQQQKERDHEIFKERNRARIDDAIERNRAAGLTEQPARMAERLRVAEEQQRQAQELMEQEQHQVHKPPTC